MADYAKILRDGVKMIKAQTASLQPAVSLKQYTGQDVYGKPIYASAQSYNVILVQAPNIRKTTSGQVVAVSAYAAFLEPVKPNGAAGRTEPIDTRDLITLPDGTTGPIVDVKGFIDAGTGAPMFSEVWIGQGGGGALDT
jgi:hypothetical protein